MAYDNQPLRSAASQRYKGLSASSLAAFLEIIQRITTRPQKDRGLFL